MATSVGIRIKNLILSDSGMMDLLPGGVYTHEIARDQNNDPTHPSAGSTPNAFESTGKAGIKRNVVIVEGTQDGNSGGPPNSMWGFPTLWFRSQPKQSEKDKLEDLYLRTRLLFRKRQLIMPSGSGCIVRVIGRLGPIDDKSISDSVVLMVRLQVDGIWEVNPND